MQALIIVGDVNPETNKIEYLCPAVIKANGWAGTRIKDAFIKWENVTKRARVAHADSLPAWFFYGQFGTVFNENSRPVFETVGTGNNQSPITPCQVFEPDTITLDYLDKVFIGDTCVLWADLSESAEEWLTSWDRYKDANMKSTESVSNTAYGQNGYTPPPPPNYDPDFQDFDEDEIPF